jgi:hypothetical protein
MVIQIWKSIMPELVEGPSPLSVRYVISLPHSLLATISLLCAVPRFEGLGDWLREARARLPGELLDALCFLVTFPGGYQRFTGELLAQLPTGVPEMTFEELMAHLEAMPGPDLQQVALRALARGATPRPEPDELLARMDEPGAWAAYLDSIGSEAAPEAVARLARDGHALRGRLLDGLDRFWRQIYAEEYAATRPLMERSVFRHRARPYNADFHDRFTATTGRLVPEGIAELLPSIQTVTFIPCCYVGPYVAYTHHAQEPARRSRTGRPCIRRSRPWATRRACRSWPCSRAGSCTPRRSWSDWTSRNRPCRAI